MDDPRERHGLEVHEASGPFRTHKPANSGGALGGTLDRGIIGHVDGDEAVIGEVWAKCPNGTPDGVRVDSVALAEEIVFRLNIHDELVEALRLIEDGVLPDAVEAVTAVLEKIDER